MSLIEICGYIAAMCTTSAYAPQVLKVWQTRSTADVSLKTFLVLVIGQSLWLVYAIGTSDVPLMIANGITLVFTSTILFFKRRFG